MDEPYSNDLHARVSVLENDNHRHEKDLRELWEKTTCLEVCASSLPTISTDLKEIKAAQKATEQRLLEKEAEEKGEEGFMERNRTWIINAIFLILGALAVFFWNIAAHIQYGVK